MFREAFKTHYSIQNNQLGNQTRELLLCETPLFSFSLLKNWNVASGFQILWQRPGHQGSCCCVVLFFAQYNINPEMCAAHCTAFSGPKKGRKKSLAAQFLGCWNAACFCLSVDNKQHESSWKSQVIIQCLEAEYSEQKLGFPCQMEIVNTHTSTSTHL